MDSLDAVYLAHLEDLYTDLDEDEYYMLLALTQHPPTSPPVQHTNFHPKSSFNPIHVKGPYIQSFYQVDLQIYKGCVTLP